MAATKRIHGSSSTAQLVASRDEYRQHIEDQDLDAELLTFLAGVTDSIALELLHRRWPTTATAASGPATASS